MIWPGKNSNSVYSANSPNLRNYYEVEPTSWLAKLYSKPTDDAAIIAAAESKRRHYFRIMSQAMAERCSGYVYIMAVKLNNMGSYIGIWPDTEYPAVKRRKANGAYTDLIGINSLNPSEQYL